MDDGLGGRRSWGRLKLFGGLLLLVFCVTLASVVGSRLSEQALAVLAGAVCGVGAAIPTSLLIVAVSQRRQVEERRQQYQAPVHQAQAPPPVIVVTPQAGQQRGMWNGLPASLAPPAQRQFTVVGGEPINSEVKSQ